MEQNTEQASLEMQTATETTAPENSSAQVTTEQTSSQTETPPAPETDWKAEAEKSRQEAENLRSQIERETQLRKVAEGRLAKEAETNKRLLRVERYARQAVPEEERGELDKAADEEAQRLQQQIEAQEYTQKQIASLNRVIDNNLKRLGKNLDTDPSLAKLKVLRDSGALGEVALLLDEMVEADQTQKAEQARIARQTRQEKNNITTPREVAAAIQVTDDNADALFNQGKITAEQYRAVLRGKGIL